MDQIFSLRVYSLCSSLFSFHILILASRLLLFVLVFFFIKYSGIRFNTNILFILFLFFYESILFLFSLCNSKFLPCISLHTFNYNILNINILFLYEFLPKIFYIFFYILDQMLLLFVIIYYYYCFYIFFVAFF